MKRIPPLTRQRARQLRHDATDAERILWYYLRNRHMAGCKFRRQHPVGAYIVDFVCLEARLIVEIDGSQHMQQEAYDAQRTRALNESGFRVLRFWNNDVMEEREAVLEAIWRSLQEVQSTATPTPAPPPCRGRGKA